MRLKFSKQIIWNRKMVLGEVFFLLLVSRTHKIQPMLFPSPCFKDFLLHRWIRIWHFFYSSPQYFSLFFSSHEWIFCKRSFQWTFFEWPRLVLAATLYTSTEYFLTFCLNSWMPTIYRFVLHMFTSIEVESTSQSF